MGSRLAGIACLVVMMMFALADREAPGFAQNGAPSVGNKAKPATSGGGLWKWIWAGDGPMPPETLYFRHAFVLAKKPVSARLLITADDSYSAFINGGKPIAEANDWTTVREYDVTSALNAGDNLLAVACKNTAGPGGLIYKLILKTSLGRTITLVSDEGVRVTRNPHPPVAWTSVSFDDQRWKFARVVADAGGAPWNELRGAPTPDYTRFVRLWDIRSGGKPTEDSYTRQRGVGQRMLLSTSYSSRADMQILKGMGFTLFQSDSDHLTTEEIGPRKWDFQRADTARQVVQRLGLDWCYFPHEAFPPKWYRETVPFTRIRCLEHDQTVEAFSPWDLTWPAFVDRGYEALANNFLQPKGRGDNHNALEALYVGIHGDYGEAGLLTGARKEVPGLREDWLKRFGNLHDHLGFWCADPVARKDFRAKMLERYGSLSALNVAWNRHYEAPDEIVYPRIPVGEPSLEDRRMWLDFVNWYEAGVGHAIDLNMRAARKHFPDTMLMLSAGFGDENVRGGNDNSLIPKLASKYRAGVRSTHGHFKPFADNAVSMLGRLGSASRFYGAPFWIEPQGALSANDEVERIFEAVSQGATGYFDWASNAVNNRDVYYRYGKYLRVEKPVVDVAMFYPAEAQKLRVDQPIAATFARATAYLRDMGNFDIVDDRMVRDDCLQNYRVLVLWEGMVCEKATLDKIKEWVNNGGVLLAYDFNKVRTFEGDISWFQDLFGYYKDLAPARVTERYLGTIPPQYRIQIGKPEFADYLMDSWYDPETTEWRWTGDKATIRLPVQPDRRYTLVVRAYLPPEAEGLKHQVFITGRRDLIKIGDLSATGDVTYHFPIPEALLSGKSLATLTIQSETVAESKIVPDSTSKRQLGVRIQSIQMVEQNTAEDGAAPLLPGRLVRELDLRFLNPHYEKPEQCWARLYGKGLTIYFPANKSLLKGYIEVVRQAMNHLSSIDPERRDALPIDDVADGVYATLFTDKILFYNPKDTVVTKSLNIPIEAFDPWKDRIDVPAKGLQQTLKIEPHSIAAVYFHAPSQELVFECEGFTALGGLKTLASPDCSPGIGQTCVRIPAGAAIVTKFTIDVPGRYKLFTRCLRNGKLEPVDILLDGQPLPAGERVEEGQTLLSATVNLTADSHTLVLKARDRDVRADFVLLSNDPTISGYDFATRTVPVE